MFNLWGFFSQKDCSISNDIKMFNLNSFFQVYTRRSVVKVDATAQKPSR